ncbi:MAG: glycoside hydrolase family 65 protein [Betaproteobacteria bacterium]|nr:glycoside hydrolase family 65 protein [Betaproteobacteria bacterium]MDH3437333.1 glycoside hydrolase family 65 protein [Betaproteobacteria bacterium]
MKGWALVYEGFEPRQERLREALCTLGNGYFATRGAAAYARADDVHYPGTYLAGGYNRLATEINAHVVENEDLVNLPNWLPLKCRVEGSSWLEPASAEIESYHRTLDLKQGLLTRRVVFRESNGRRTRFRERRLVHMHYPHLAAIDLEVTAENWSGTLEVLSALDGRVVNSGVARYRALSNRHLEALEVDDVDDETVYLKVRTLQSRLEIAQSARTRIYQGDVRIWPSPRLERDAAYIGQAFAVPLAQGETSRIEKVIALYSSRDRAISECGLAAREGVARAGSFEQLQATHLRRWNQLWQRFDIGIEEHAAAGTERTALTLRLHIFHLLQTASTHTIDLDVGVPARGWHGEAYRGHIFWDELFIFPLLNWRLPEITRALLMYRYRRLNEARANARAAGYRGAMYPWQSGSSGREETQPLHLNPESGRWLPDHTYLQRHINAAIAHNVWQYYQVTRDMEFFSFYGAEMILEIARFWSSIATFNEQLGRYEIRGVTGPDEFQTTYPDASEPGLDNHAYTNIMAVWVLCRGLELLDILPEERRRELREELGLGDEELARWEDVSRRMRIVFHGEGIISQFEGYEALKELDWERYRRRYSNIQRLDRLLEAEGDTPNRYKASKQADVLMLFYLFSSEELKELFDRLGYPFEYETIPRNVDYYSQRTSHGSTLSRVVHSWVLSRSDRPRSWQLFKEALESDIADIQGGTTPEGIHLGAMAGNVDLLQRGYAGIVTAGDVLWLNPCLPRELRRLRMTVRYRGHALDLTITQSSITLHAHESNAAPIQLGIVDNRYLLQAGETREFSL